MSRSLNNWQRRGLGLLAIGGGAIGLAAGITAVLQGRVPVGANFFAIALGTAFFVWGVCCGVQMLEGSRQALFRNAIFWMVQTPLLQTPIFGYSVFCGTQLQLFVKFSPVELGMFASILGAQFNINLGQPGTRIAIGVNLVALCLAAWLMRKCESAEPALVPDAAS